VKLASAAKTAPTSKQIGVVEVVIQQVQVFALVKPWILGDDLVVCTPEVTTETCGTESRHPHQLSQQAMPFPAPAAHKAIRIRVQRWLLSC
jgi:hypothetical protein